MKLAPYVSRHWSHSPGQTLEKSAVSVVAVVPFLCRFPTSVWEHNRPEGECFGLGRRGTPWRGASGAWGAVWQAAERFPGLFGKRRAKYFDVCQNFTGWLPLKRSHRLRALRQNKTSQTLPSGHFTVPASSNFRITVALQTCRHTPVVNDEYNTILRLAKVFKTLPRLPEPRKTCFRGLLHFTHSKINSGLPRITSLWKTAEPGCEPTTTE